MNGFSATASMASAKAIQALCQAGQVEKCIILQIFIRESQIGLTGSARTQKLHPHICCATHNDWAGRSKMRRKNRPNLELATVKKEPARNAYEIATISSS
jgi:hypothetical protein